MIDVKESYPVEVAEYVEMKGISDEPAFVWWILYTLKKRDQLISVVNNRVKKGSYKYGKKFQILYNTYIYVIIPIGIME